MSRFRRYFLYRTILFISIFCITVFFIKERAGLLPLFFILIVFIIDEILTFSFQKNVKLYNILIDLTYLSIFIVFTGGSLSPFAPFYLTLIVLGSYLLTSIDSFIIAGFSGLFYGVICLVMHGLIPKDLVLIEIPAEPDLPDVLLNFIIYSLAFIFTAALSSLIVERFRREVVQLRVTTKDILESIDYGILTLDNNGRIVWSNSTVSMLLDMNVTTNENINNIAPPELIDAINEMKSKKVKEREFKCNKRLFKIRKNDIYDRQGTILIINDITESKEIERKMQMRDKLVTLGQFAANLAHGVRNPVSSIRASAELIDIDKGNSEKNKRLKKLIIEESDHLNGLVRSFLDFSRGFEINKIEIELREVCDEVITSLKKSKYYIDSIEIMNNLSDSIRIEADYSLLKSVLMNIGTNSLKAMRDGGRMEFNIYKDEKDILEIVDTGCGIKDEDKNRIFSPFYSRFNDGFGFGLAIVEKIVELHGWDIEVDSKINQGTSFKIIL